MTKSSKENNIQCPIHKVRRSSLIREFMEKEGYLNYTNYHGVRKNHKRNNTWDFKEPEKMLNDFAVFLKNYYK